MPALCLPPVENVQRVVLVEDDPGAARLFAEYVSRDAALAYSGTAVTLQSAVALARHSQPQIVRLDVSMPDGDGLEFAAPLRQAAPHAKILAWTGHGNPAVVFRTQRQKLHGAIHKLDVATLDDFLATLEEVRRSARYFSPRMAKIAERFHDSASFTKKLSDKELMFLPYFGKYPDDASIAARVGLSPATIHSHRTSILAKLNLRTTAALILWLAENGFTNQQPRPGSTDPMDRG